jgi:hypothetical protein
MDPRDAARQDAVNRWRHAVDNLPKGQWDKATMERIVNVRSDLRRVNLAHLALTMSLIGCLLFVTAPIGVVLGFMCLRGGSGDPRPGERVAMWAIILGLLPISVVTAVVVEHFIIRQH